MKFRRLLCKILGHKWPTKMTTRSKVFPETGALFEMWCNRCGMKKEMWIRRKRRTG